MVGERIILGWWGGEPIWRQKTAAEEIVDLLEEDKNKGKDV